LGKLPVLAAEHFALGFLRVVPLAQRLQVRSVERCTVGKWDDVVDVGCWVVAARV
jgi:hypothetical protein